MSYPVGHAGVSRAYQSSGLHHAPSHGSHVLPHGIQHLPGIQHGLHHDLHHGIHHDTHHDLHHGGYFYFPPFVRYASYPRYSYAGGYSYGGGYSDGYGVPVGYTTPTVVVTAPAVRYADPVPVPEEPGGPAGAPAGLPGEGSSSLPRDAHGLGAAPVLRAPLVESKEAPEVLPPPPDKPK